MNLADFYAARNRTSGFMDPDYGGDHWGQDFNSASRLPAGTPIPSLSTGRVVRNSWQDAHGWYIAIQADQPGWYWTYSHRQSGGGFDIGELIQKGESVGQLGNTGWSTAPPRPRPIHTIPRPVAAHLVRDRGPVALHSASSRLIVGRKRR